VIGTVGHIRSEKNYARLVAAFATLRSDPRVRLIIVGDGDLRSALDRQISDLGLSERVVFAGTVADPVETYRAMDLFALSSDTEQMPLVVLEAMGAGLPVVSTDVGDVREMIVDANRRYVTPLGDEEAYARALAALAQDAQERTSLGRMNRARCLDQYDLRVMIDRYHALYSDVLHGGQKPH